MTDERHEELTDEELAAILGGCCCRRTRKERGAPMAIAESETDTKRTVVVTVTVERLVT